MKNISALFNATGLQNEKWLIIGKGPSYDRISEYDTGDYKTFGLNHVAKDRKLTISHMIDFDVFTACKQQIYDNAEYVVMPLNPHIDNKPTHKTLNALIEEDETLRKIDSEGRLFWYNHLKKANLLGLSNLKRLLYPRVEVRFFSAEAALYLLAMHGVKDIYSIGVDGGSCYSNQFDSSTLLANSRKDFNHQFDKMAATIKKFDTVYSPVTAEYPVKVYVGTQEEQMLATDVLEYSIKKHTKVDVEVIPLHRSGIVYREPVDEENRLSVLLSRFNAF